MTDAFEVSPLNRVKRLPERGKYDKDTVYKVFDAAMISQVGFTLDGQPYIIPTLFARDGDDLLLHGATTSRMLRHAAEGNPLCISVTLVDGIVMARSVFHHSINYRSAVAFGHGEEVSEPDAKMEIMRLFVDKILPGRWDDARLPSANEFKATMMVRVPIESASAKMRTGMPGDDDEDIELPIWAGVLPVRQQFGTPIDATNLPAGIAVPSYISDMLTKLNG